MLHILRNKRHSIIHYCHSGLAFILLVAVSGWSLAGTSSGADAAASVEDFHNTLLEIMRNGDDLGYHGRYDKLKPVIEAKFDLPLIAQVILGRHWQEISEQQQQRFIEVFKELTIATYANRFSNYDGETFNHKGTESLNKNRLLVQTQLRKADGDTVNLDYLMHQRSDSWHIMSVVAQGVNDLSLKRAEYTSIVEAKGLDGLIADLRKKITNLEPATTD